MLVNPPAAAVLSEAPHSLFCSWKVDTGHSPHTRSCFNNTDLKEQCTAEAIRTEYVIEPN